MMVINNLVQWSLQPAELIEQLETTELWSMAPAEKLAILRGLCLRIMNSYSVQDYMNECQETATEQWSV